MICNSIDQFLTSAVRRGCSNERQPQIPIVQAPRRWSQASIGERLCALHLRVAISSQTREAHDQRGFTQPPLHDFVLRLDWWGSDCRGPQDVPPPAGGYVDTT